jgi:hypothetical protein
MEGNCFTDHGHNSTDLLTQSPFFGLCPSSSLKKNVTLRKPDLLRCSAEEAPKLMDPYINLLLFTGWKNSCTRLNASLLEDGSKTGVQNVAFF